MNSIARSTGITIAILFAVTGCGGGGGSNNSSSNNNTTPANSAPVAITSANATAVASDVIASIGIANSFTAQNPFFKAGSTSVSMKKPGYRQAYDLALSTALKTIKNAKSSSAIPAGIVNTVSTTPCSTSGDSTVSWNDANNNGIEDAGDSYTFAANQCTETLSGIDPNDPNATATTITNGSMTFTLNTMQGDPNVAADWSFGVSFAMNLSVTYTDTNGNSSSLTNTGGASLTASYAQATTVTSGGMTGSSFKYSYSWVPSGGNSSGMSIELANFNFADTSTSSDNTFTKNADFTLRASDIGGSVTVVTDPVFAGVAPGYPTSGKMVITGANNSQIVIEANSDGATATVTVNGAPQTMMWSDLGM